jgi:hypothetical protein
MWSPADPIFWSHHAMIDKQWALWQDCHGYDDAGNTNGNMPTGANAFWGSTSGRDIDDSMPFPHGGTSKPATWNQGLTTPRDYAKIHDLGDDSYMYEMDDLDQAMSDILPATSCPNGMDWHGFATQAAAVASSHAKHFATSAGGSEGTSVIGQGPLPLNLDEEVQAAGYDVRAARAVYQTMNRAVLTGAFCQSDDNAPYDADLSSKQLADSAYRVCSAVAAQYGGRVLAVAPFP